MPINARQGQAVTFNAVFLDTSGVVISTISSATMTVTYPPVSNSLTTTSCSIGMTAAGQDVFTVTWSSSVAALGLSYYAASAPGIAAGSPGTTGILRLIS